MVQPISRDVFQQILDYIVLQIQQYDQYAKQTDQGTAKEQKLIAHLMNIMKFINARLTACGVSMLKPDSSPALLSHRQNSGSGDESIKELTMKIQQMETTTQNQIQEMIKKFESNLTLSPMPQSDNPILTKLNQIDQKQQELQNALTMSLGNANQPSMLSTQISALQSDIMIIKNSVFSQRNFNNIDAPVPNIIGNQLPFQQQDRLFQIDSTIQQYHQFNKQSFLGLQTDIHQLQSEIRYLRSVNNPGIQIYPPGQYQPNPLGYHPMDRMFAAFLTIESKQIFSITKNNQQNNALLEQQLQLLIQEGIENGVVDFLKNYNDSDNKESIASSEILKGDEYKWIIEQLRFDSIFRKICCKYNSSGFFDINDFHQQCDNMGPLLYIIRSDLGNVFGAYITELTSENQYKNDAKAFIFSVTNKTVHKQFRQQKFAVGCFADSFLRLGGCVEEPLKADVFIVDIASTNKANTSNLGYTYQLPDEIQYGTPDSRKHLAGDFKFNVDKIEVYLVRVIQ